MIFIQKDKGHKNNHFKFILHYGKVVAKKSELLKSQLWGLIQNLLPSCYIKTNNINIHNKCIQ